MDESKFAGSCDDGLNILLVDDHEGTLRVMSRLLVAMDHRVTTATAIGPAFSADDAPEESDASLAAALAAGDRDALGRLYDRYGGRVMAVALRIVGNTADAERVVQAVFAEAWQRPYAPSDPRFPAADLTLSARRLAIGTVRGRGTRRRPAYDPTGAAEGGGDPAARAALGALRPQDREAVVLVVLDGFTPAEVADAIGVPIATIGERVRRGLGQASRALSVPSPPH